MDVVAKTMDPGAYRTYLEVANRASREATDAQRDQIRRIRSDSSNLHPAVYTARLREIMGW